MSETSFEAEFQDAENNWQNSKFAAALDGYRVLLFHRLSAIRRGESSFSLADIVISERLADLSILFGEFEAADKLLEGMVSLCEQVNNRYGADYASLKRIHLALSRGIWQEAYDLLKAMKPSLGDIEYIEFSTTGLAKWEKNRYWPDTDAADRAVLFSRIYLIMGKLLATLGQYQQALIALERGLTYSFNKDPHFNLARQAIVPLQLAMCAAHLEKGDLNVAYEKLKDLFQNLNERLEPGFFVHWLELNGKLNLLWADFGKAKEQFEQIVEFCQQRGFNKAVLKAAMNLANVLIFLNQISIAKNILTNVKRYAEELNDQASVARTNQLNLSGD